MVHFSSSWFTDVSRVHLYLSTSFRELGLGCFSKQLGMKDAFILRNVSIDMSIQQKKSVVVMKPERVSI